MTEVVSVKFKNRGKSYYFSPNNMDIHSGELLVVETSKGLELANCYLGNHEVEDDTVIQPLRPVVRIATDDDRRVAEINKQREKEAFDICKEKIVEHNLEMKLLDVECNFEGNKVTFFFTADGRVDFRELVKNLASIFRSRIELRQIGVRDETKLLGGLGMCGRPYCCSTFMDDFQPVSTKMAKTQNLSLNPTKISGACGRLMCCLRYEQEAYDELIEEVPKQGAFVETHDGFGTVSQVNLLRKNVKVRLDGEDEEIKQYDVDEIAVVKGGRPADGSMPKSVLKDAPRKKKLEVPNIDDWVAPDMFAEDMSNKKEDIDAGVEDNKQEHKKNHRNKRRKKSNYSNTNNNQAKNQEQNKNVQNKNQKDYKEEKPENKNDKPKDNKPNKSRNNRRRKPRNKQQNNKPNENKNNNPSE